MAEKYRRIYTRPLLKSFTRWRGWIHPLNATVKHLIDPSPKQFMLKLAVDNIAVKVWLNKDAIVGRKVSCISFRFYLIAPFLLNDYIKSFTLSLSQAK
ncbi:hypothetical protein DPMN_070331 [Dreissena polymorpha]|uniref:Uncharacterized protein n=1 Tax=Dreissena polymorpha TaxID=45954 RepID=A0A9D4BNU2_DREPO|nr:hypothetical protein DPMN_070331 [Dreissena polymorpha]